MYRAYQRACKQGTHWLQELYGTPPRFTTRLIADITYELMIEEQRLIRIADAKARKEVIVEDRELRDADDDAYRWVKMFYAPGKLRRRRIRMTV